MAIDSLAKQIRAIKLLLKELVPGNRYFSTVCGTGSRVRNSVKESVDLEISFWDGMDLLFKVGVGNSVSLQDLENLISGGSLQELKPQVEYSEPEKKGRVPDNDVKMSLEFQQRMLTRYDYYYYVLNISKISDQEYDRRYKEFTALLEGYPGYKLPWPITRSIERSEDYPEWVRKEIGDLKPKLPKGAFF
jgi:hypothetical protein